MDLIDGVEVSAETVKSIYENVGLIEGCECGLCYAYNRGVRGLLGERAEATTTRYNGVSVAVAGRRFDSMVPFAGRRPYYEHALLRAIRENVVAGEALVLVGGGYGVSTVVSAKQVGPAGSITAYEGADAAVERMDRTIALNEVDTEITVTHSIVSSVDNLRGDSRGAATCHPEELPECDVLILDCEGAEVEIIPAIQSDPRLVIVETHGDLGAPPGVVERALRSAGFDVVERIPAHGEPETKGQFVIVGTSATR